jgi:hypothetical protein
MTETSQNTSESKSGTYQRKRNPRMDLGTVAVAVVQDRHGDEVLVAPSQKALKERLMDYIEGARVETLAQAGSSGEKVLEAIAALREAGEYDAAIRLFTTDSDRWVNIREVPVKGGRYLDEPIDPFAEEEAVTGEDKPSGESESSQERDGRVDEIIRIRVSEAVNRDLESFLDLLSHRVVGHGLLMEISYDPVGVGPDGELYVRVTGYVEDTN